MLNKAESMVVVLTTFCLMGAMFSLVPAGSDVGTYDIWADIDNDGNIDMRDLGKVARLFGTSGTNVTKASIEYDSGWINITDKQGKSIVITHNLNSTGVMIYITGKTTEEDGAHQRHLGATGNTPGWNKTYGGVQPDEAYALVRTSDNGYALAGRTFSFGAGGYDFWLVKTDGLGNVEWNKTYGGEFTDWAFALVETVDGGYALAGATLSIGAGGNDFWLVKTGIETGSSIGLSWVGSSANSVSLYRGSKDTFWNYVRVRVWVPA